MTSAITALIYAAAFFALWCLSAPPVALIALAAHLVIAWLLTRLVWANATPGFFNLVTVLLIIATGLAWPIYAPSVLRGLRSGELVWRKKA